MDFTKGSKGAIFKMQPVKKLLVFMMVMITTGSCTYVYPVEKFNFTGYSVNPYGVKAGQISNSLYYLFELCGGINSAVRRINSDNTLNWMKVFSNDLTAKSLSVDATETTVCFASYSTIRVTCLYANNGSVFSAVTQ